MENERGTKMKKVVKLLAILMLVLPSITTPVTVLARGGGARSGGARSGGARSGGARSGGARSGGARSGGSKSGGSKSGGSKSGGSKSSGSKSGDSKSSGSKSGGSKSSGSKSSENNTTNPKTETPKPKTETPKSKTDTPKSKTDTPKSSWTPPVANFNTRNFSGNSWSQPFTQPAHRSWSDNLLLWYALFHNNGSRTTNVYNTNPLGTNNNDWSNTSQPIGPTQQNYTQNNEDVEKKEKTDWKKIFSIGALIGLPLILTALIFVFKR